MHRPLIAVTTMLELFICVRVMGSHAQTFPVLITVLIIRGKEEPELRSFGWKNAWKDRAVCLRASKEFSARASQDYHLLKSRGFYHLASSASKRVPRFKQIVRLSEFYYILYKKERKNPLNVRVETLR